MDLYRGRRLSVEEKTFILPDGAEKKGIVVHPGEAVVILPRIGDDCLLLKQWRFAINSWIYEVPAGKIETDEDILFAAKRELIEETGYTAGNIIPRGYIYPSPGYTDEKLWLFEAFDLKPCTDYSPDDDERIEVIKVPLTKIFDMISEGEIVDSKTMAILLKCCGKRL